MQSCSWDWESPGFRIQNVCDGSPAATSIAANACAGFWEATSGARQIYASTPESPRFNPTVIALNAAGEPLLFSHTPSIIYTLREPTLLADAEPPEELPEEALPTAEDVIDSPEDIVPNDGAS